MKLPSSQIKVLLLPLSWLYGAIVGIRNWLYDINFFKHKKFEIPVICVGNITVGGTGKTPHIEYLIELLSEEFKVGVLSRGYKRKSKGFRLVNVDSTADEVGDEPLQIKRKFPKAFVYVDKDRKKAIENILLFDEKDRPDLILLDDGFQHRRVSPSLSILLIDSNRPIHEDCLLPAGRLRESFNARYRASIVIYTKCKDDVSPLDLRILESDLDLYPFQKLYFTTFNYGEIRPLSLRNDCDVDLSSKDVLLVTGIAYPQPLVDYLSERTKSLELMEFPDHYSFKEDDINSIMIKFKNIDSKENNKIIITTEKDATRFCSMTLEDSVKDNIFYIPIKVVFLKSKDKESFNKKIFKHVRNYQTNS